MVMPDSYRGPRIKSANSLKHDMMRKDAMEKWERSQFKGHSIKIVRLQPSINNDSIAKYQTRPANDSSRVQSSKNKEALSSPFFKSKATQTGFSRAASAGIVREKPPGTPFRPSSTRSAQSRTYNARSPSCRPSSMYRQESLRTAAKLNRPPSHVLECDYNEDNKRAQYKVPKRFDGTPVNLPGFVRGNEFLCHENLDLGQKQYIWGVARVYSVAHMMELKQRQYQSLLDYEFHRRMQNKDLKEHERIKEWKDYERYCRFIKRYEQRIPRSKREQENSPCQELSHIHRHTLKGWTTNADSKGAYRPASEYDQQFAGESTCTSALSDETVGTVTGRYEMRMVRKGKKKGHGDKSKSTTTLNKENKGEETDTPDTITGSTPSERPQFADKAINVL